MITIILGDQIVVNHTHNLWVETCYMGGIMGILGLIYYVVVIPLRVFQPEKSHHSLLMAFMVYFLFVSALKLPFFGSAMVSVAAVYANSIFAIEGERKRASTTTRHAMVPARHARPSTRRF